MKNRRRRNRRALPDLSTPRTISGWARVLQTSPDVLRDVLPGAVTRAPYDFPTVEAALRRAAARARRARHDRARRVVEVVKSAAATWAPPAAS